MALSKNQLKEKAQDLILQQAAATFYLLENMLEDELAAEDHLPLTLEIKKQNDRVARLFNYDDMPFLT